MVKSEQAVDVKIENVSFSYINAVIGGALLVTGTCIGGGMLGLPVKTAAAGLLPTISTFIVIWLIMTFTALILLEVSLYFKGEVNFISMASKTIGPWGSRIAWLTYLLFLYSLMAAYTAGGTTMVADIIKLDITTPNKLLQGTLLFTLPFIVMVYCGALTIDYVNRLLIIGLVVAFSLMCSFSLGETWHLSYQVSQSKYLGFALTIMVTSFGYHLLIPTLKSYLKEDIKKLRLAIIIGSFIPLVIYLIWELVVFSLIPVWGKAGLVQMLYGDKNPAELLMNALSGEHRTIAVAVAFFSFFALTSSFIGVALGLFDFFADGLRINKNYKGKIWLSCLTFLPPILFTFVYPQGFLLAIGYAGIFASILLIIYPVLMAWYGRYIRNIKNNYQVIGGKIFLFIAILFGIVVIIMEILSKIGLLPVPFPF